jgi:hypothetical protein
MDMLEYRRSICNRLHCAQIVPFVRVSIGAWEPQKRHCHENVDYWVRLNPGRTPLTGHTPLRGWVTLGGDGATVLLAPHSVVRHPDGYNFDITPLEDETIRPTMRFVSHIGSDTEFFGFKDVFQPHLTCEIVLDNFEDDAINAHRDATREALEVTIWKENRS